MTAALVIAILSTVNKLIDLYHTMLIRASPEDAALLLKVIVKREAWWQQYIWEPIGEWFAGLHKPGG